jgi:cytochrome c biogenesis protein CcmG/thiol:disulfide interchange protein DsbE
VIAGIVGVALALLVVVLWPRGGDSEPGGGATGVVGNLAPQLVGTTAAGDDFDLDKLRGRWVVVNFFATWCPPCVQEHPELVRFSEQNADTATVVSVAYDDTPEKIGQFFAENGGDWPVLASDTGASVEYGVVKLPESFLVDPDGIVVRKLAGGVTAEQLERLIARAERSR